MYGGGGIIKGQDISYITNNINDTDISWVALSHKDGYERLSVITWVKKLKRHQACSLSVSLLESTWRKDQKKVGLPWVQSSRNYSLTWKRRQLIHSGKLSVLRKFLSLSPTSLISALCNMLNCVTFKLSQKSSWSCSEARRNARNELYWGQHLQFVINAWWLKF